MNPMLYWIDLETTGLDARLDSILEIYVSVARLTDPWNAMPLYHGVFSLAASHQLHKWVPFVREMHEKNGLIEECRASSLGVAEAEKTLLTAVEWDGDRDNMPTFAGSSVHFDAGFIRAHMPALGKLFSHRVFDVSAIKLLARALGMEKIPKGEAHRAEADVAESIAHGKTCVDWIVAKARESHWYERAQQNGGIVTP